MREEFTTADYVRLQRFRHLAVRTVAFQRRWDDDLTMGFVQLADFAEGAMRAYEINENPLWDLTPAVPDDEEAFGALATVVRWTTQPYEEVYFEKVIASIQRLDTESNRERLPSLLREAILNLPQHWERAVNPDGDFVGYRKLADLTPPSRRTEGWSLCRELAEQWIREDVATGNVRSRWPADHTERHPSDRYWVAVVYFSRLIQLVRHTDQIRNLLRLNGLTREWEPE